VRKRSTRDRPARRSSTSRGGARPAPMHPGGSHRVRSTRFSSTSKPAVHRVGRREVRGRSKRPPRWREAGAHVKVIRPATTAGCARRRATRGRRERGRCDQQTKLGRAEAAGILITSSTGRLSAGSSLLRSCRRDPTADRDLNRGREPVPGLEPTCSSRAAGWVASGVLSRRSSVAPGVSCGSAGVRSRSRRRYTSGCSPRTSARCFAEGNVTARPACAAGDLRAVPEQPSCRVVGARAR